MTLLVGSIFHMTRKIVSEMTYNVSMGTLNPTIPTYLHISLGSVINEQGIKADRAQRLHIAMITPFQLSNESLRDAAIDVLLPLG